MHSRSRRRPGAISILSLLALLVPVSSFYLPGVAPTSYKDGDYVPLFVNHLAPSDEISANVHSVFAFDYYSPEFHFCQPPGGPESVAESLGSILFGDRILTSPFDLRMRRDEGCKAVCDAPAVFEKDDALFVNERILQGFNVNWLVDGLPAGHATDDLSTGEQFASPGFPLGEFDEVEVRPALHNHYDVAIEYHEASKGEYRVVGILVVPSSRRDAKVEGGKATCGSPESEKIYLVEAGARTQVFWTYSVTWKRSDTPFATRWDKYLHVYYPKIHWVSLILAAVFVICLVTMVSTILMRTLRKDIARYNRLDDVALEDLSGTGVMDDGVQEDSGWKLVHGDVFRPPAYPLPLSILVGNGAQLFMMAGFTIGKVP